MASPENFTRSASGLEGPHAQELVHLALAVLHDEAGVTQVLLAAAGRGSRLF